MDVLPALHYRCAGAALAQILLHLRVTREHPTRLSEIPRLTRSPQQANLVDITYLFDSGALVDFSTSELVGLVRALFANSEKRDTTIERIESGVPVPEAAGA